MLLSTPATNSLLRDRCERARRLTARLRMLADDPRPRRASPRRPGDAEDMARSTACTAGALRTEVRVEAMAETGAEPVYSMGDDIPSHRSVRTPRRIYGTCASVFAQSQPGHRPATREGCDVAARPARPAAGTLEPGRRSRPRAPAAAPPSPSRRTPPARAGFARAGAAELARVLEQATVLDATYAPDESLSDALLRCAARRARSRRPSRSDDRRDRAGAIARADGAGGRCCH